MFEKDVGFVQTIPHLFDISDFKEYEILLHNLYVDDLPVRIFYNDLPETTSVCNLC